MRAAYAVPAIGWACDGGDDPGSAFVRDPALDAVTVTSEAGRTSHEAGGNCMSCHGPNGEGPGRFTFAGTVFAGVRAEGGDTDGGFLPGDGSTLAGAIVELRTAPFGGGELRHRVIADDAGNFYTTEAVDFFGEALFPTVFDPEGVDFLGMPFPTQSGACNMCHHLGGLTLYVE